MQHIVQRVFGNRKIPENMSSEQFDKYMGENFPAWVKEFEDGGFLEKNKLPPISGEDELIEKLHEHKNDLLVIKFWKHGCIPCLSVSEMYKETEAYYLNKNKEEVGHNNSNGSSGEQKKVVFYSVDTKSMQAADLVNYQLVEGTPTIHTFMNGRQVGGDIQAMRMEDFRDEIEKRMHGGT